MASALTDTARSISQVALESLCIQLRGLVQTVFPLRSCATPTAASETQDYGMLGDDGPIEGATKVFQVTIRDLGAEQGGLHRINVYFYDTWADKHSGLVVGDEISVAGPAASLIRQDPSAGSGDHPFCLIFHGSGGEAVEEDGVKCELVKTRGQIQSAGGGVAMGAASERRAQRSGGGGSGDGARPGTGKGKASYAYTELADLKAEDSRVNVYGVVCSFSHPHKCKGRDMTASVGLLDESRPDSDDAVPCNFFSPSRAALPAPLMVGDILRVHRAKMQQYRDRPQLLGVQGVAWLIIRRRHTMRETFQRGPPGAGAAHPNGSSGGADEDLDADEDSQRSGADAGGGEADDVLSAAEWEVQASSANYTLSRVDYDRCNALQAWIAKRAPHLWLKPAADPKIWVQDVFRRPLSGPIISETEVDLVCCLVSKHEKSGGGAGSLNTVFVADGTGFSHVWLGGEWDARRETALTKGVRFALGIPDWSPSDKRPPPLPAFLKVEILENTKEWEALALAPGMWIRLRRLTVVKNRETATMSALMRERTSSVNPLHPGMAEVQAIARAYAAHCASADKRTSGRNSTGTPTIVEGAPAAAPVAPHSRPAAVIGSRAATRHATPRWAGGVEQPRLPGIGRGIAASLPKTSVKEGTDSTVDTARRQKRPRLVPQATGANTAPEVAAGGETTSRRVKGSEVSNLGTVRSMPAPNTFTTRAKVVDHFPAKVKDFVQQGPGQEEKPRFLFALRLEDDHGVLDAIATGANASLLLPGWPTPEIFRDSEDVRIGVEQALSKLEAKDGPTVELRLHSYVTPVTGGLRGSAGSRPSLCKRFALVVAAPPGGETRVQDDL